MDHWFTSPCNRLGPPEHAKSLGQLQAVHIEHIVARLASSLETGLHAGKNNRTDVGEPSAQFRAVAGKLDFSEVELQCKALSLPQAALFDTHEPALHCRAPRKYHSTLSLHITCQSSENLITHRCESEADRSIDTQIEVQVFVQIDHDRCNWRSGRFLHRSVGEGQYRLA